MKAWRSAMRPGKSPRPCSNGRNGTGVDVILDLVGGVYFPANLEALALRGRLICVGTTAGPKSEINIGLLMRKRATIIGTVLRARSIEEKAEATRRFAASVLPLVSRGAIRPVIECVYTPEEIRAAHEHLESNRTFGKIVPDVYLTDPVWLGLTSRRIGQQLVDGINDAIFHHGRDVGSVRDIVDRV